MKGKGLKVGVEIHQQLDTNKLFCECKSDLRDDVPNINIQRRLYAVAGESGKVDAAAAYEESKKRKYIYEGYSDTTCEVEFDESPPRELNEETLRIGLQIALLLNAKPVSVAQVMRKTVVDGSNTSGFQRTLLLARNGYVKVNGKKIGIYSINLEEDSGRRVAESKDSVTFRLDRLGIPLVEITTAPDISTPKEVKEVVLKIGEILRACKVKRGIGTIRQDLNVSIAGGDRTEIKGVQDPALIPKIVENEAERQASIIHEKEKVHKEVRNALPDGTTKFLRPMPSAARLYPETDLPLIKISDALVKEIGKNLPKLKTELKADLIKKGLSEEFASVLLSEGKAEEFESLFEKKLDANLIAKMLVLYPKDIANKEKMALEDVDKKLSVKVLKETLQFVSSGKLSESAVRDVLVEVAKGKDVAAAVKGFKPVSLDDVGTEIKKIVKDKPGLSLGAYMGMIMPKFKGKVDPSEIAKMLGKLINK